jgi:hypothetical protein
MGRPQATLPHINDATGSKLNSLTRLTGCAKLKVHMTGAVEQAFHKARADFCTAAKT